MNVVPAWYRQIVLTNPENILTSSHKRDRNFLGMGEGSVRPKHLRKCTKLDRKFSRSGGGGLRNNLFCGGGMDIFWNCTKITLRISIMSALRDLTVTTYMQVIYILDQR